MLLGTTITFSVEKMSFAITVPRHTLRMNPLPQLFRVIDLPSKERQRRLLYPTNIYQLSNYNKIYTLGLFGTDWFPYTSCP